MSEGDIVNHLRRVLSLMTQIRNIILRMEIGIPLELFDEAVTRLKRSHVIPTLSEDVTSDLDLVEESNESEKEQKEENSDSDSFELETGSFDDDYEDEFMEPAVRF